LGTLGKGGRGSHRPAPEGGYQGRSMRLAGCGRSPKLELKGKQVVVIDRDYSFGRGGILATEIMAQTREELFSVIAGIGGQESLMRTWRILSGTVV